MFTTQVTTTFDNSIHLFTSVKDAKHFVKQQIRETGKNLSNFKIGKHVG